MLVINVNCLNGHIDTHQLSSLNLGQSGSINRYLASLVKKPGFYPSDPAELAYCDMIHETAQDIAMVNPIVNVFKDEMFQQKKAEYFQV